MSMMGVYIVEVKKIELASSGVIRVEDWDLLGVIEADSSDKVMRQIKEELKKQGFRPYDPIGYGSNVVRLIKDASTMLMIKPLKQLDAVETVTLAERLYKSKLHNLE